MLQILTYHAVIADSAPISDWAFLDVIKFERQMELLARQTAPVLHLEDAFERLQRGELLRPVFAITFDDGYRNNLEVALPILRRFGLPATIFLTTGLLGDARCLWSSRILLALSKTTESGLRWGGQDFTLVDDVSRQVAARALQILVKQIRPADPGQAVCEIEERLRLETDPSVPKGSPFSMMDKSEARAALSTGLIRFGAHSVTHPILSALDDRALEFEVGSSVEAVSDLTGEPCRTFAYPNGRPADYDRRALDRLVACGVRLAVTTTPSSNASFADPLRLSRWPVGARLTTGEFRARLFALGKVPWVTDRLLAGLRGRSTR